MNTRTPRDAEIRTLSDRQAQARLERLLAARRAAEAVREAKFRQLPTPRSQFRAAAKAPLADVRPVPPTRTDPHQFTWRDAGIFILPAALIATLLLVAHWAGWLS